MFDFEKLLFYDVEVFKFQSCVVFKNYEGETVKIFTDNIDGLGEYFDTGVLTHQGYRGLDKFIEGQTLVGYNNYHYDDFILYAMTDEKLYPFIKDWNDSIINGTSGVGMKKINTCTTVDVFQQIDISFPSLKKIEGNMGKSIVESSVDFNIDRKLTPSENLENIKYCEYDVKQTVEIFKLRQEYFETKERIIDMIEDEHLKTIAHKWNTTSIVGQILKPEKPVKKSSRFVPDEMLEEVPLDVKNMWLELDHTVDYKFKVKKKVIREFGNNVEFGWGGLHGAPDGVFEARNVKLIDVTSMYPSILINFEGLGDKTERYQQIKADRVKIKESGENEGLNKAYKLILNSTYGLLNNQYSNLHNPKLAYSICIYGQISLYSLARRLAESGCEIFNINTDGVAFVPDVNGNYTKIIDSWEQDYNLKLEEDSFDYWIQKDVNNYIAVTEDGYILTKGGDVNSYYDFESGGRNYYFNNSNTRIVQKAIVDKIVHDIPIKDTIVNNRDKPILYQYILQAGKTYIGTYDNKGNRLQNVNRVFAGKNTGYEIYKKRLDGGMVKYPDAPDNMIVYNGNLEEFDETLDLQWYYDLSQKVYERWRV